MSVTWFALPPPAELGECWSLGFLTAARMLECRGEGEAMAGEERDKALWANAALLSKVLLKEGEPAFEDGKEVLSSLTVGQIEGLVCRWWRQDDFSERAVRKEGPVREEGPAAEGGENERFDMARFLELGGRAEADLPAPAGPGLVPSGENAVPLLWPRSSLPLEALVERQRAYGKPYTLPGAAVPFQGGKTEAVETSEPLSGVQTEEGMSLEEGHHVVQIQEPEVTREGPGLTLGDLDRAVERDARRYGGGFTLL